MSISGQWNATLKSPMGPMQTVLTIEEQDGKLTGSAIDKKTVLKIEDGTIEGNTFSWKFKTGGMMAMTLAVSGSYDGDSLNAEVSLAGRGKFPLSGTRITS
jgi:hypothetical protein